LLGRLYINGRWISSSSRKTFDNLNPATGKSIGKYSLGNEIDVNKAVQASSQTLKKWKNIPTPQRGEILLEIARLLKKNKNRLAKLEVIEMGKVYKEAAGDVQEAIDIFEYMAGEGRRLFGITTPSELKNKFCMTIRQPLGVIGLITPWNFPIAIPAWKLAPALVCGNTVIFKPSSDTPQSATELVKILEQAGIPKGVVNLVTGSGQEVGTAIVKHPKIQGISFTGNVDTGKFITANAGLKKVGLELGGKNAIIIMDDANLDLALEGVIWGAFGTTGQRCTATSRVILHNKRKSEFEEMLIKKTSTLKLGSGLKKNTDVGPLINKAAQDKSEMYTKIGKKEKAKLLAGGEKVDLPGFFFKPTVFTNVKPSMRIAQEEIFGPIVSLISVKNLKEAIKVCNDIKYGLSSAIYTTNIKNAFKAIEEIEAGLVYVNSSTIGAEVHLPFGGVKDTGHGREAGPTAVEEFSEIKTIYVDYSNRLQKAQGID